MKVLNNDEMMEVKGGGFGSTIAAIISGAIVFFMGVFDGFMNPRKCNN